MNELLNLPYELKILIVEMIIYGIFLTLLSVFLIYTFIEGFTDEDESFEKRSRTIRN